MDCDTRCVPRLYQRAALCGSSGPSVLCGLSGRAEAEGAAVGPWLLELVQVVDLKGGEGEAGGARLLQGSGGCIWSDCLSILWGASACGGVADYRGGSGQLSLLSTTRPIAEAEKPNSHARTTMVARGKTYTVAMQLHPHALLNADRAAGMHSIALWVTHPLLIVTPSVICPGAAVPNDAITRLTR